MSKKFIDGYEVILLDQVKTFMFENDRFGPDVDYFSTYISLGGGAISAEKLKTILEDFHDFMLCMARDPKQVDCFHSVEDSLKKIPSSKDLPGEECKRIDDLVALHEIGTVSDYHWQVICRLAKTHRLGIVSNIWAKKDYFV